jgi:hypothetical protein
MIEGLWGAIICAAWAKEPSKREAYVAATGDRRVGRLAPPLGGCTFDGVLHAARALPTEDQPVLVGFDAPFGLPASFLPIGR